MERIETQHLQAQTGFLLFVPKEDVVILDMKYEDAIKLIVSAGMVIPENQ